MKKYAQNLFSFLLILFISSPTLLFAQNGDDIRLTLNFKTISLKEAFKEIEAKSKVKFIYNEESVKPYQITLSVKNETVKQILTKILTNTKLDFQLSDNKCIIIERKDVVSAKPISSVGKPSSVPISSSVRRINGKVISLADGLALPNVTVSIKETPEVATQTNANGEYTIILLANSRTIVFKHLGYVLKETAITSAPEYNVELETSQQDLKDVIVIGPFSRKAESFTGSASTFDYEQLRSVGNQNIIQSLKVLDPSFIELENNLSGSDPNTMPDIQIRGENSLPGLKGEYSSNPNLPLFILDGFESSMQKIYDLDMNRVASVTILKDASAKAIYGSRAANGVVVVETKRPEPGKLRVSYTSDLNLTIPDLTSYDLTNAEEKLQAEVEAGRFIGAFHYLEQSLAEQYNQTYSAVASGVNTYWLSQPLRTTGVGQKHTLSLEGGDPYLRYGADFSYNNLTGAMKGSLRTTTSGNVFLSYRFKNLMFRNTLTVNFNKADDSPYGSFSQYSKLNPYWAPYNENGDPVRILGQFNKGSGTPVTYYNPLYDASIGTKNFSRYTDITNNLQAEWSVLSSLKIIGRFGYTQLNNTREDFYPASHTRYTETPEADFFKRGDYSISDGRNISIKTDITLNYSKQVGKNLFFLNGGWNLYETNEETHGLHAQGFLNDRVDNINFAKQYLENGRPLGSDGQSRETGLLSALNYSFDDRYLADLTYRIQGSSVFGSDNRWGKFWSAGIGWNIHKEAFFKENEIVNQLKLRASTGYTGSQNFNPYQAMATYDYYTDSYYDNIVGAKLMALANNKLKWQQTQDYNFGADVRLIDRFNLRFDYYISNTDNLLTDLPLPGSTGFSTIKENLGEVQNKGIDATLSFRIFNIPEKTAFLNFFFSAGTNKNKLVKVSEALKSLNDEREATRKANFDTAPFIRYKEGESMNAIYVVRSLGIDPTTGNEIFLTSSGEKTYAWNANDQVAIGDATPKMRGSFGFNTQYKGWGMNCAFTYQVGGQYYNQTLVDRVENVDIQYNVDHRVFADTWKQAGDNTFYKKIGSVPSRTYPTSRFAQKLNELNMTSLNASYDFKDAPFLINSGFERLKLTMFTNNLFRISSIKTERGLDFPYARTLSFSVQATF